MVIRAVATLGACALAACALEVPDPAELAAQCRPAGGGPNCNGDRRRDECEELGLPAAYGFDTGCKHPVRPNGEQCDRRRQGLYRCEARGDLTCCYE